MTDDGFKLNIYYYSVDSAPPPLVVEIANKKSHAKHVTIASVVLENLTPTQKSGLTSESGDCFCFTSDPFIPESLSICNLPDGVKSLDVFLPAEKVVRDIMQRYHHLERSQDAMTKMLLQDKVLDPKEYSELKKTRRPDEIFMHAFLRLRKVASIDDFSSDWQNDDLAIYVLAEKLESAIQEVKKKEEEVHATKVANAAMEKEKNALSRRLKFVYETSKETENELKREVRTLEIRRLAQQKLDLEQEVASLSEEKKESVGEKERLTDALQQEKERTLAQTREIRRLQRTLFPVHLRCLIDNARKRLMKAVMGDLPKDYSWHKFIQQPHTSSSPMLQAYLRSRSITVSPLTPRDFETIYDKEGRDRLNEAVHEASPEELKFVVEIERNAEKKAVYQRLLEYQR
ncbi:hypothetical protein D9613_008068 [Agrocybe pediades]|uniref:Uncharacterized protein n=1 Tax=Agrocybe pediades TaxID=84607 RepID=A0A8H4QNW3_9AGAR|nr:hypothetical protein D9613_008068 [Agrocybe pediades]